jgi:O-antigen/teichoic acid export membrane protein
MNAMLKNITREANFLSLAGNLAVSFFGFTGFALLARSFSPLQFGEWVLFLAGVALADMLRFGVTNTAVIRYLSGAEKKEGFRLIGSFILIVLTVTVIISFLIWSCYLLFPGPIDKTGYALFFIWYPILAFISIPFNTAQVILQAELRFDRILLINALSAGGFFLVVLINYFFLDLTLTQIVLAMIGINLLTSLFCILMGWDGIRHILHASRKNNKLLLDFGKYTTFTLIGTNLLRSADTLIISLSPLGMAAVALYSIPMKLTELQQIPLRSFAATAFPKMSKASIQGKVPEFNKLFYTYSGAMTYLFAFISLVTFVFADFFVLVAGGRQYLGVDPVTGASAADIVRIFSLYGLLLPVERMTGIGLDSINKPQWNFRKVMYMLMANVAGDLVAVFLFHSLLGVAVASIVFTLFGIWLGFYFMGKQAVMERKRIFSAGIEFYRLMFRRLKESV